MEITIRQMKNVDWKIMQRLNTEVFESDKKHVGDLDCNWPESEIALNYYKSVANGNKGIGFIAEINEIPVGYMALETKKVSYRTTPPYVEIENMGVSPEYRSKGVGSILLKQATEWATTQNITKLYVSAFSGNAKGIAFYKDFGFSEIAIDFEMKI